jgi:uncharacterized protein YkwD
MFANDYWAHVAPDGTTPWSFIKSSGYAYTTAGENLARDFNDTGAMVEAWMNSASHRENIVNAKFKEIGVAVVNGTLQGVETTLVVQLFGAPAVAAAAAPQAPAQAARVTVPETSVPAAPAVTVIPTVALEPAVTLTAARPIPQTALGVTLTANTNRGRTTLVQPLMLTKAVALAMLMLLLGVLLYDEWLVQHHKIPRTVGKNWAHLTLFSMAMVIVLTMSQGKVL